MTREEAIDIFEHNWTRLENHDYTENELNEALDMATKALEQEPKTDILDKIRAEIIEGCGYSKDYVGAFTYSTIKVATVLQILDKYKAKSEVEDG